MTFYDCSDVTLMLDNPPVGIYIVNELEGMLRICVIADGNIDAEFSATLSFSPSSAEGIKVVITIISAC